MYDSLASGSNANLIKALRRYVHDESLAKTGKAMNWTGWSFNGAARSPKQEDGSSCGAFTCFNAKRLALEMPLNYVHSNVDLFRIKIAFDLSNCQ
jgi:Ulp1 family protease